MGRDAVHAASDQVSDLLDDPKIFGLFVNLDTANHAPVWLITDDGLKRADLESALHILVDGVRAVEPLCKYDRRAPVLTRQLTAVNSLRGSCSQCGALDVMRVVQGTAEAQYSSGMSAAPGLSVSIP